MQYIVKLFNILVEFYKKAKKLLFSFVIFPSKLLACVFGTGCLPVWGNHWTAVIAIAVAMIIVHFTGTVEGSLVVMSIPVLKASFILYLIGLPAIYILKKSDSDVNEQIVSPVLSGQMLLLAISGPATMNITKSIIGINRSICTTFLYCEPWFFLVLNLTPIFAVPYIAYRFTDILKPWPASYLDKMYSNGLTKTIESISNVAYAVMILYSIAFIFCDLTMVDSIEFFIQLKDNFILSMTGHVIENQPRDIIPLQYITKQ